MTGCLYSAHGVYRCRVPYSLTLEQVDVVHLRLRLPPRGSACLRGGALTAPMPGPWGLKPCAPALWEGGVLEAGQGGPMAGLLGGVQAGAFMSPGPSSSSTNRVRSSFSLLIRVASARCRSMSWGIITRLLCGPPGSLGPCHSRTQDAARKCRCSGALVRAARWGVPRRISMSPLLDHRSSAPQSGQ